MRTVIINVDALRTARVLRGISQEELSRRLGVNQSWIGLVENGRTSISPERLVQIAQILEVPAGILLAGVAKRKPREPKDN